MYIAFGELKGNFLQLRISFLEKFLKFHDTITETPRITKEESKIRRIVETIEKRKRRGRRREGQLREGGIDNQITCTHRINYQSGGDCASLAEGRRKSQMDRERRLVASVRVVTRRRSNRVERKIVRENTVSSDPATVIFPSCVGVREREFTPLVSGMTRAKGVRCV